VFQRLLDSLQTISGEGAGIEGWLYTTALTLAAQRQRQSRPQGLAAALWELPAQEREVLALRLLARLDVSRIASATGVDADTVLSAQSRGLRRLSARMASRR
jgi:DNA-directed RNA polymerase specialized sigma24 family protein